MCPCKTQVKEGGSIERQPKRDNMRMILSTLAGFEDGEKSRKSRNAVASRNWKRQVNTFSLRASRRKIIILILIQ